MNQKLLAGVQRYFRYLEAGNRPNRVAVDICDGDLEVTFWAINSPEAVEEYGEGLPTRPGISICEDGFIDVFVNAERVNKEAIEKGLALIERVVGILS